MHDYYPIVARAVARLEGNTPVSRRAVFERIRIVLIDQLHIRQPPLSDSEIVRERLALEDAIRKVEFEFAVNARPNKERASAPPTKRTPDNPKFRTWDQNVVSNERSPGQEQTSERDYLQIERPKPFGRNGANIEHTHGHILTALERADGRFSGIFEQKGNGVASGLEQADTAVPDGLNLLSPRNFLPMQWLDQLMLDAARPFAPDSLRCDGRTVLKWLNVETAEAIKTEHYDQITRAFQKYIKEWQRPCAVSPETRRSPPVLNDDIRSIFSRLLEREQAAVVFDGMVIWFANIWIRLIIALNLIAIIGLLITAPTMWLGIVKLTQFYSPFNLWNWIAQALALSPSIFAFGWVYRGRDGPRRRQAIPAKALGIGRLWSGDALRVRLAQIRWRGFECWQCRWTWRNKRIDRKREAVGGLGPKSRLDLG